MGLSSEDIQFFCRSSKLRVCNPSGIQTSSPVWIAFLTSVLALYIHSALRWHLLGSPYRGDLS